MELRIEVEGDLVIDDHHTVEDTGLALGEALRQALGDRRGLARYGFTVPMDETLATCALDLSGRPGLFFKGSFSRDKVGELATEMVPHFFHSLVQTLGATLHISVEGVNAHHQVEGVFKAVAKTLQAAIQATGSGSIPSTKGAL
jgi:imidazoleglycerol-phosphate dehydratase/histidinol-phosphatase